ncbi:pyridoxamine 5'-phosphate oxidase family protein [Desulfosporosinus sp. PR]|uniref:pyridoxamine 5'-phosphate oxidase family protein n=1 Tax=Candidatus Desulfosporosinus nitrosoreducens TaxID=3401928 RepID=UPI0027FE31C8|nr:pyridoxamine 5'-phosphate oxidase family protein [Desulfosporosinus sp. PR]MDQ7092253.1 pyridoxamine 5'-phosphate oxidase family protein [Desulfosporosinus sp. PR]
MFKEMRNRKKQLNDDEAREILLNGEYGVLATGGENGYSYATPLNYVYLNDKLYFHCAAEGHKLANIALNNRVSFCVVGKTLVVPGKFTSRFESVILFGKAALAEEDEKREALLEFIRKYSPNFEKQGESYISKAIRQTCVVKIEIERITGKASR